MTTLSHAVSAISDGMWVWLLTPIIVLLALYFTVKTRFGQITLIPEMFRTVVNKAPRDQQGKPLGLSAFQSFTLSAGSRVGVSNVAGIGTAIAIGGPGAVFWMWMMALLVGAASLIEASLAQLYKVKNPNGTYRGGPAYYIYKGLKSRPLANVFAVALIVGFSFGLNSLQANTLMQTIKIAGGGNQAPAWVMFVIAALLVALMGVVIFGGVRRIARVTQFIIPGMAVLYLILGIVVVIINHQQIPWAVTSIIGGAWGLEQFAGGSIGTVIATGIRRGMLSSEAGLGSSPNGSATAGITHPVKQGLVETLGVYFDTWLVASITAFIILVSKPDLEHAEGGIALTQQALTGTLGRWAVILLVVIIAFVAFASLISNYYFGETNIRFLTDSNPRAVTGLRIAVLAVVFVSCLAEVELVWSLADAVMGIMALINLVAVALLSPIGLRLWRDYKEQLDQGRDPVFTTNRIPGLEGAECWVDEQEVIGWSAPERQRAELHLDENPHKNPAENPDLDAQR